MIEGESIKAALPPSAAIVAEALVAVAPAAVATQATVPPAPAPVADPVPPVAETPAAADASEDIGTWRYAPWKGIPHWIHTSGETSFDRAYVRALRKMI